MNSDESGLVSDNQDREKIYSFNVVVTDRCNANCTYCHYYAVRDRKSAMQDIPDELFRGYMKFIRHWVETVPGQTSYRFSGGDPMILGDRLFDLAEIGFSETGLRPYMLTAGKSLNRAWIDKAHRSKLSHVFVSIENPVKPDPGAPNPFLVAKSINDFNSDELPIIPGVCVVPNECFKDLYQICNYFYETLGRIPLICEVNYSKYRSPSEKEWRDLTTALPQVIKSFFPKTQLNLFSSVVPEYAYGGRDPYLLDLNLDNSHGINRGNFRLKNDEFLEHLKKSSYPHLNCPQSESPWLEFCQNTKWYWQGQLNNLGEDKLNDYCRFKRTISDILYRELADKNHEPTICSIR